MTFTHRYNLGGYDCHNCYHLLGIDVILDDRLQPIVIEVSCNDISTVFSENNHEVAVMNYINVCYSS